MFHPLAPDLTDLSLDDLNKRYSDLMAKMNQAYRFGPTSTIPQMQMLLAGMQEELSKRQQQQMDEMQKIMDERKVKSIIDIK